MKRLIKLYFAPSAIKARILGDISLIIAILTGLIDLILPLFDAYSFGPWFEQYKGFIIAGLIAFKYLTNFSKKKEISK